MRGKRSTSKRQGQRERCGDVILSNAEQLSSWLGVDALAYLSDDECERLIEAINSLTDDAFKQGWDAMLAYNHDHQRLLSEGPTTEH